MRTAWNDLLIGTDLEDFFGTMLNYARTTRNQKVSQGVQRSCEKAGDVQKALQNGHIPSVFCVFC